MKKSTNYARIDKKNRKLQQKEQKFLEKYGVPKEEVKPKEKQSLKHLKQFLPYLKNEKKTLALLIALYIIYVVASILGPLFLSRVVDTVMNANYADSFKNLGFFLGTSIIVSLFWIVLAYLQGKIFYNMSYRIRLNIVKQLSHTKISKFNTTSSGEILSRINTDPNEMVEEFDTIFSYIPQIGREIGRVVLMFVFSWLIGGFVIVGGITMLVIANIMIKKVLNPAKQLSSKIDDKYMAESNELVKGIRDIKSLNIFGHFLAKFKQMSTHKRNSELNIKVKESINESIVYDLTFALFDVGLIALGIYLVIIGEITLGVLSTILIYDYDVMATFVNMAQIKKSLYTADIHAKRITEISDPELYPKEEFGTKSIENAKGTIDFENVTFDYGEKPVLANFNLHINAGECVGIVGRSGEGKSTILSLIPRINDPKFGKVFIDGVDIQELSEDSLRNIVSIVPQSPYIFNLSIRDNLKLVTPNATDDELREACRKANILDFIESSEKGFETVVGEGGVVLSGGQKQRLAIARAFLKKSKILLLDEATSALDNESQNEIKNSIREINKSCTIIIVAHRLSTVLDCDKIAVLSDHKIVAYDKHEKLIETCGIYQNLYKQEN